MFLLNDIKQTKTPKAHEIYIIQNIYVFTDLCIKLQNK